MKAPAPVRDIRAILESVEAKLDALLQGATDRRAAPSKSSSRRFPAPLTQEARDAIDVALSGARKPITARDLIKAASDYTNELSPGGQAIHSIRCYLAEKAGLSITWANSPGVGSGRPGRPHQQRTLPLRDQDDDDGDPA